MIWSRSSAENWKKVSVDLSNYINTITMCIYIGLRSVKRYLTLILEVKIQIKCRETGNKSFIIQHLSQQSATSMDFVELDTVGWVELLDISLVQTTQKALHLSGVTWAIFFAYSLLDLNFILYTQFYLRVMLQFELWRPKLSWCIWMVFFSFFFFQVYFPTVMKR